MRGGTHLILRGRVFHFRRAVPADMRPLMRRRELSCSLRTSDLVDAKHRALRLYLAADDLFQRVRASPMLTDDQLAHLVQDYYSSVIERENRTRLKGRLTPEDVRVATLGRLEKMVEDARLALARNDFAHAQAVGRLLLQKRGITTETTEERSRVGQAMLRAMIEVFSALSARYEGDFNYEPKDKLLRQELEKLDADAPQKSPRKSAGPLLSTVTATFPKQQIDIKVWERQTAAQARKSYELFVQIAGDRPVTNYTREDAGYFRETLQRLPALYAKSAKYRGMTVNEISSACTDDEPRIQQKTVKRHFSALSSLWEDLIAKGAVDANIFGGFRFKSNKKASEDRSMWADAELQPLFASPVWSGCLSAGRRSTPGSLIIKDAKYWVPLIGLYSGMRQEEICQLHLEDIEREEAITFFNLNDRPPRKLKNRNAVRRVPVHSKLIELGLMKRLKELSLKRETLLFPELKPGGADDRLGHDFSKWFTRYRKNIGIYRPGLDFHSLRHTATTLMHRAGVERTLIDELTGHSTAGETSRYTKGASLNQLQSAIETIRSDVVIAHLQKSTKIDTTENGVTTAQE